MFSTHLAASVFGTLLAVSRIVQAGEIDALWFEPSLKWYGIDGNWSAMGLFVGEDAQQVDVLVSTSLSEIWVVETGGCSPSALCTAARGNVFNISASKSWYSLGAWELGLDYLDEEGNGDYAMETVVVYNSVTKWQTNLQKQVVAGINDTDYYNGFFGLGITPGRFSNVVAPSPIANMVEQDGVAPSHSYGYTAGAYYAGQTGVSMSLTVGGYDQNRFVSHGTSFSLNATTRQPEVLIRDITASVPSVEKAPTVWSSTSQTFLHFNESVTAIIDSSTPYLWLPTVVCDRFADALNLTWNDTFGLYLFSNNAVFDSFSVPDLSFTFVLSSTDNTDNFGQPLNVPGVVNITISANAFAQTLRYPFMNLIGYGDAAIPYFPLRRADNGSQLIIGRSFLQEAYMITNYETSTFSVHQALFPNNPLRNTSIITVQSASNSPYPGPAQTSNGQEGLTTSQIVGIVIGACLIGLSILFTVWWIRRRRRKQRRNVTSPEEEDIKDIEPAADPESPRTPVARILSRIATKFSGKKAKKGLVHEAPGSTRRAVEVGADQGHARYELPVPLEPIELDATDAHSINGTTELGTEETQYNLSSYEMARRKLDRALQGPVPQYTATPSPSDSPVDEPGKSYQDVSHVAHYRPSDRPDQRNPSPESTPTHDNFSYSLPSPVTPHGEWPNLVPDIPSPMPYPPSNTFSRSLSNPSSSYSLHSPNTMDNRTLSRSASSVDSSVSRAGSLMPQSPAFQRTPIDASKVVCLGPLPSNIRLPHQASMPRLGVPDRHLFDLPTIPSAQESRRESAASLGSNFTVEEEAQIIEEMTRQATFRRPPIEEESRSSSPSAQISGRIDGGDLVHVPQPPTPTYDEEGHSVRLNSASERSPMRLNGTDLIHVPQPGTSTYPGDYLSVRLDAASERSPMRLNGGDFVHVPQPTTPTSANEHSTIRLNTGADFVHVPVPAEKRYSWEN